MINYYLVVNIVTFFIYVIDKLKAIFNLYRIPEILLIILSIIGGVLGGILAMLLFHHKIRKNKFIIINFLALVINIYLIWRYI